VPLDFFDGNVTNGITGGGRTAENGVDALTAGVNWYLNSRVRGDGELDALLRYRARRRLGYPAGLGLDQVDGDNLADVCLEESAPRRGRPRRGTPHVLGHGEFGDLIAEEAEFGLDPAPTPGRVFSGHAADQGAELKIEQWATQ
jgi:hypothetical protein